MTTEKILDLPTLLSENNVTKINSLSDINKIYDYQKLFDSEIVINNKRNAIIIFDTEIFNSTYVIDVYNEFVKNHNVEVKEIFLKQILKFKADDKHPGRLYTDSGTYCQRILNQIRTTDVFYCDNIEVYNTIFTKFFKQHKIEFSDNIRPVVLTLNVENKDIFIDFETFTPLNTQTFISVFLGNLCNSELFFE